VNYLHTDASSHTTDLSYKPTVLTEEKVNDLATRFARFDGLDTKIVRDLIATILDGYEQVAKRTGEVNEVLRRFNTEHAERVKAERALSELHENVDGLIQTITDPENQPNQLGIDAEIAAIIVEWLRPSPPKPTCDFVAGPNRCGTVAEWKVSHGPAYDYACTHHIGHLIAKFAERGLAVDEYRVSRIDVSKERIMP
jgi:hypothetical protein